MERSPSTQHRHPISGVVAWCAAVLLAVSMVPAIVEASTTLLVNNESFNTIDQGDGSTDREMRFGTSSFTLLYSVANSRFELSRSLFVRGSLTATGSITTLGTLSGARMRVSGNADVQGALTASGLVRFDDNLVINDDRTAATDAVLTFGNATANQTLTFIHSTQRYKFSTSVDVAGTISGSLVTQNGSGDNYFLGNVGVGRTTTKSKFNVSGTISGSSLSIDNNASISGALLVKSGIKTRGVLSGTSLNIDGGSVNIRNVGYTFTNTQGGTNTFLKNDGAGNLTWAAATVGNSSGAIMSMHPEYPNAVYFSSGSTAIGQLAVNYDTTNKQNYYRWTSSKVAVHDQWVSIRVRLPTNFIGWDSASPIQFRYRTGVSTAANNYLTVKLLDTGGGAVALTSGNNLANTSWTQATITGPQSAGTFTAGSIITLWIKLASDNTGSADAGDLQLNIRTSTP